MIGAGVRDSCRKSASRGDPVGESRGGSPDRLRKANALRSNQRPNCTGHKNRQTRFSSSLSIV
ncbi:hypothetical protein KEH51_10040 [[Brevibacterium] frigoritolerans]|uniref:Uncharacterized protein n=1 Tax=Peribacillus frigoritolerans TaxID=450367 RepID=A0A941FQ81_9BACI|nr:hypothetical protein [Peribacillus frigoritolerans]